MRDGLSPEYSTKNNDPLLKDLQVQIPGSDAAGGAHSSRREHLTDAQGPAVCADGEVVQIECDTTKNGQEHWLIDGQEIEGDRVIGGRQSRYPNRPTRSF